MTKLEIEYKPEDTNSEINIKNKKNIQSLLEKINSGTIVLKDYPDKNDFQTNATDGGVGTYEKDGHPIFLIKFAGVAYEYPSFDALALALNQIETNKQAIAQLKKLGQYRGTYVTIDAAKTAIPAPNKGDIVHIGTNAPFQEQIFNGIEWEAGGQVSHSISLQQVANQQDPKIATAKAEAIADADAKLGNKADKATTYSKTETDAKYEPKSYNFTDTPSTLTKNTTDGTEYILIAQTPEQASAPIGSETRLIITNPATPAEIPDDNAIVAYGLDVVYKQFDNIAQLRAKWVDVKDNIANGKVMVLKRLDDLNGAKRWVIEKWEDKQQAPGAGGHWETIDLATHTFTQPEKLRITYGTYQVIATTTFDTNNNATIIEINPQITIYNDQPSIMYLHWSHTRPTKLETFPFVNGSFGQKIELTISKTEIWKET